MHDLEDCESPRFFGRLEVMEERELASERIVKYEEMCGRNVTIIMAVFLQNGLVHLTEQIGRMKARLFNESGRPCDD